MLLKEVMLLKIVMLLKLVMLLKVVLHSNINPSSGGLEESYLGEAYVSHSW